MKKIFKIQQKDADVNNPKDLNDLNLIKIDEATERRTEKI